jgi:hypothetical protein
MDSRFQQIDRTSPLYREFARLHRIAREMRPSSVDRWNGELYARSDGMLGGFDPRSRSIRLSQDQVLAYLTGSTDPVQAPEQAQALATVLHELYHARNEVDALNEPTAVRTPESRALDEGLIERAAINDFPAFAKQAGYHGLRLDEHAYHGAVEATDRLVAYAAQPARRPALIAAMLDRPTVMRWDAVADEIVRNRLGDVVPQDAMHQQYARAELVNAMAHAGWNGLDGRPSQSAGEIVGADAVTRLDAAVERIRVHYRDSPGVPYPAVAPNRSAPLGLDGEQARPASVMPAAAGRQAHAAQPAVDPAMRLALGGQPPPSGAVRTKPDLGDGARGRVSGPEREAGRVVSGPSDRER